MTGLTALTPPPADAELPDADLPALQALRSGVVPAGLPTLKSERWKYTDLDPLRRFDPQVAASDAAVVAPDVPATIGAPAARLVLVNGVVAPSLSDLDALPAGVTLLPLAAALAQDAPGATLLGQIAPAGLSPFLDLSTAWATGGAVLHLARNTVLDAPLEILWLAAPGAAPLAWHPRLVISLEQGAQATVIDRFAGRGASLTNLGVEIALAETARLNHIIHQDEDPAAFHIRTTAATVARDAAYDSFTLTTGARLSRGEHHVRLTGTGAHAALNGAYLIRDHQHADVTTLTAHEQPHGTSQQTYAGVIDGNARGVFQGKIHVLPDAQKTDGYQLSRALLLSSQAEINSKPELEIYADDVKCSHGATSGQLDAAALFYLRSRGIPEAQARALLIEAFVSEALDLVPNGDAAAHFRAVLAGWMREVTA